MMGMSRGTVVRTSAFSGTLCRGIFPSGVFCKPSRGRRLPILNNFDSTEQHGASFPKTRNPGETRSPDKTEKSSKAHRLQNENDSLRPVLVGNSFPLSLIRRTVTIRPMECSQFLDAVSGAHIYSFWGHRETLDVVRDRFGVDLTPREERPAVTLSADGYPVLYGKVFRKCWIVSPVYEPGFRPAYGSEVPADKIVDWQILLIEWLG